MLLKPPAGGVYRDTADLKLVPADGKDLDPTHLDVSRALADGDLVPVHPKKAGKSAAPKE